MPKETVVVNGVALSRAQVEAALAELNQPVVRTIAFEPFITGTITTPGLANIEARQFGNLKGQGLCLPERILSRGVRQTITWTVEVDHESVQVLVGRYTE